jgi:DNA-binding response OmpR family regulator
LTSPYTTHGNAPAPELPAILVVDDEPELTKGVARILRLTGFRVAEAFNNTNALDAIERELPNVVLSDINRPGGNGIDLIRELRAKPRTHDLPVIFMTGAPTVKTAEAALALGAFHYLVKPIGPEDLLKVIYKALRYRRDPVVSLVEAKTEQTGVDYKRELDLGNKRQRAELARDMIAMANTGGGTIIIGVQEERDGFSVKGAANARDLDPTKVGDAVRGYVGSVVKFSSRVVSVQGALCAAISVSATDGTIALAQKSNQEAGLFTGRIYVRTSDARTTELTDPVQLAELLERAVEQRLRRVVSIATGKPTEGT